MPNPPKPWTLASISNLLQRFRSNGVLAVSLWLLVPIGIVIFIQTGQAQWDKPARFIALFIGVPISALALAVLMERFKLFLLCIAILMLLFVVGVLLWVSL
jgi:hypothetical protein